MDFIFMLTQADATVPDGLRVLDDIADLKLRHIGFKDVGADREMQRRLNTQILAMGATSYLEMVSLETQSCVAAARMAAEIGVNRLLGGTAAATVLEILKGTGIEYYPYPGFPTGHPVDLRGSKDAIAEHCANFAAQGCAGADLLAYRATEAMPLDLVAAARGALGAGRLIVAGSISSVTQLVELARAGVDAFTVGTAVFENSFSAAETGITRQIRAIQAALDTEAIATT
ncbi:MAG: hypothetical protein JSU82_13585 [Rhodospirillales bacterium]|nr:MAG: hypothetical protein JSU82_13585 [Rhodospirillales bacterium]